MRREYRLPRCTPESVGVSSRALLEMVRALEAAGSELHGVMLARHGKVILEGWWRPQTRDTVHICHSFGKSYVATAVGAACTDGLMSEEDRVIDFFPEEIRSLGIDPTGRIGDLRVKHVLMMSNGMSVHAMAGEHLVRNYLTTPVDLVPGEKFLYNTAGSCMLGEIVRRVTGRSLLDYLRERVLDPIGFDMEHFYWMTFKGGLHPAPGVASNTENNLRLGMLYLQDGQWQGQQLIDPQWMRRATEKQIDNDLNGYGYQLWIYRQPGSFRFCGGHGQDCFMSRSRDLALAINQAASEPHDMNANFDIIDRYLFNADLPDILPEDPEGYAALVAYMQSRRLPDGAVAPVHGNADGWEGEYELASGGFHIHPELCPFGDENVNRDFYTLEDEWVRTLRIERVAEGFRLTMNGDLAFTARLDGKLTPERVQSAMPAYNQSVATAVAEKDCLIVDQWFFQTCFKTRLWITRTEDGLKVRARKDRLHDGAPYLWREAEFTGAARA